MTEFNKSRPSDCSVCRRITNFLRLTKHGYWLCQSCRQFLKKGLDKIPKSELAKRMQINQDNNRLFDFSTRRRLRSARKGVC